MLSVDFLYSNLFFVVYLQSQDSEARVYLTQILHHLPVDCSLDSAKDISPHLTFICLLHLANEHCLHIHDCPTMDELEIIVPSSALK